MAQRKIMEWTKNNVYCSEEKDLIQRNKIEYCFIRQNVEIK